MANISCVPFHFETRFTDSGKYLGHESVENTYYYYHQIESAFKIVRQKDQLSDRIIPEVSDEE